MITFIEVPPEVDLLDKEAKSIGPAILQWLSGTGKPLRIGRNRDLFSCVAEGLIHFNNGIFKYYYRNKLVRFYETGDILYISPDNKSLGCRCTSEFGAEIRFFDKQELSDRFGEHPADMLLLLRYMALQSTLMHILCASSAAEDLRPDFTIRTFEPGTVIISEGAPALEIYQMIQGSAVVTVKNTQVGVVEGGEVFGEISFFTESTRTATVTAKTECIVQVMRKDEFITLAKLKPSVNLAISKTLSQRLVETNKRISGQA